MTRGGPGAARFPLACLAALALSAVVGTTSVAAADPGSVEDAKAAYDRGAAAYDAGDYARAAQSFAKADDLAPNETTLKVALDSALRADDPVVGMTLAERASRREVAAETLATAASVRAKFAGRAGLLVVACRPGATCHAKLDAAPMEMGHPQWVAVGVHAVELVVGDAVEAHTVRIEAGRTAVEVQPYPVGGGAQTIPTDPLPPSDAPPPPRHGRGVLSPTWVWMGVGISVALGGVTIASGVDTASKHSTFATAPTPLLSREGQDAQTRTNVLAVATAGVAAITGAVALFLVRWSAPEARVTGGLGLSPNGASLVVGGAY